MKASLFSILFVGFFLAGSGLGQCPTITVFGPAGVTNPGDEMTFRVEVGVVGQRIEYSWTITSGTIVAGQGTDAITVATDRSMEGSNVTAAVSIDGLPQNCAKAASDLAPIASIPIGEPVDDWHDSLSPDDKRGRLDAFFIELANNPDHVGIMVLRVIGKDRLDARNPRVQFVLHHARFRRFDKRRLWFAFEAGQERNAVFWRMLPSVEVPCDKCKIIKGGDLK